MGLLSLALNAVPALIGMFDDDAGDKANQVAGIVKTVTGTDDPTAAEAALKNPETLIKLKEALYGFQVKMAQEETKRIESVNQTMQAETQAKHWWSSAWRPFWGATSAVAFFACVIGVLLLAWHAITENDPNAMAMIPPMIMQITLLFGVPGAILGVASWHRGKEKRIKAGEK